jgi:hypothetical protein
LTRGWGTLGGSRRRGNRAPDVATRWRRLGIDALRRRDGDLFVRGHDFVRCAFEFRERFTDGIHEQEMVLTDLEYGSSWPKGFVVDDERLTPQFGPVFAAKFPYDDLPVARKHLDMAPRSVGFVEDHITVRRTA